MGVYIFSSRHGPYIKIGHYAKSNAWSRIAHRGFDKILHPKDLHGKVSVHDMELVFWNPIMTTKDEKRFHRECKPFQVIGEWFHMDALSTLASWMVENQALQCDLQKALETRLRL